VFLNILCHNGGMSEPGKVVEVEIAGLLPAEASTSIPEGGVEVKKASGAGEVIFLDCF